MPHDHDAIEVRADVLTVVPNQRDTAPGLVAGRTGSYKT
jgi:hypothetical protein